MRRCEKGEKLHFLQLSTEFFNEFSVRRLLRAPGGDTMLRIYMQAHCAALDTGGAIQLHGDMEPAEEIAILIGAPDEEIPMIATTMQYCLKCGLIKTEKNETENMIVNFTLTDKFTRAWTREALERREKKAQQIAQQDAAALIEEKPEETEEERKKREEKETKQKKREEDLARFLDAWKQTDMPKILKLQPDRKKKLMARIDDYGIENMLKAVEIANNNKFLRGLVPPKPDEDPKKKPWKATIDFFCQASAVSKILEGRYDFSGTVSDAQPQKPQAPIMITDQMVDATIYGDDLTKENWNSKKAAYMPELQAAIEKVLFR